MRLFLLAALFVALFVAFAASTAFAQPGMVEPLPQPPPRPLKSRTTAFVLGLGTTAAGIALIAEYGHLEGNCFGQCPDLAVLGEVGAAAVLVGPSLGHVYAGHTWNAGLGLRLGGMLVLGAGFAGAAPCLFAPIASGTTILGGGGGGGSSGCGLATAAMAIGAAATIGGTIAELATAGGAVDDYNRAATAPRLTVATIRAPSGTVPAVALIGRF